MSDLRPRLAPVLDVGVRNGQITRAEALHLLDLTGVDGVVRRWQRTEVSDAEAMSEVALWVLSTTDLARRSEVNPR